MTTPDDDPSDRLIDSLLREQARHRAADPALLASIEDALDSRGPSAMKNKSPSHRGLLLASAAAVLLAAGGIALWSHHDRGGRFAVSHEPVVETATNPEPSATHDEAPSPDASKLAADEARVARQMAIQEEQTRLASQLLRSPATTSGEAIPAPDSGDFDPLDAYFEAYLLFRDGLESSIQPSVALVKCQQAEKILDRIHNRYPEWKADMVSERRSKNASRMAELLPRVREMQGLADAYGPKAPRARVIEPAREAEIAQSPSRDGGLRVIPRSPPLSTIPTLPDPTEAPLDAPLPSAEIAGGPYSQGGSGGGAGSGIGRGVGPGTSIDQGRANAADIADRRGDNMDAAAAASRAPSDLAKPRSLAAKDMERQPDDFRRGVERQSPDGTERYGSLVDQPWKSPWQDALSTFSIDVDSASYTNLRRMIRSGVKIPADSVRIEECLNYFDYGYEGPKNGGPFAVQGTLVTSPLQAGHLLARVAIKGREIENEARPACNLVFLIDVSGSMQPSNRLPLIQKSLSLLIDQLDEKDQVGIVVYAGNEGVVLDSTRLTAEGKERAHHALKNLEAGGSTNGGAGIRRAYQIAAAHFISGGVNRVILATDGDFNVGTTGQSDLVDLVKEKATTGVNLTVTSVGEGNLNDSLLEAITKDGNGNYYYLDSDNEARRIFLQKLTGTLVTIAKDVKIQVEFNPGKVQAYRLLGYADRILKHEDFNNDKVDAGDIGAGHTVTAFYEIVPAGAEMPNLGGVDALKYQKPAGREIAPSEDWFTLKLRYKAPDGDVSSLIETPVKGDPQAWEQAGSDMRFASAVALFGMKLRDMPEAKEVPWSRVIELVKPALSNDPHEQRAEFIELVKKLAK